MPLWSDAPLAMPLWLCPFGHAPLGHAPLFHAPLNLHRFINEWETIPYFNFSSQILRQECNFFKYASKMIQDMTPTFP